MIELNDVRPTREVRRYKVTLTLSMPSRVGAVDDPISGADNPIAKVGNRLCVPGPSLKGALRNQLERYFWGLSGEGNRSDPLLLPCLPATKPTKDEQNLREEGKFRKTSCTYKDKDQDKDQDKITICPVCYLLGAMGLVGFVNVPFLFGDEKFEELYSARIDRASGTVARGANRSYEFAVPQMKFSGDLEVLVKDKFLGWEFGKPRPLKSSGADDWAKKFTEADQDELIDAFVVKRLEAIDKIGGYKSKGFGGATIKVEKIEYDGASSGSQGAQT